MKLDAATRKWLAKIDGGVAKLDVVSVGEGPYGLVEVMFCQEQEERTLRYLGFDSSEDAHQYSLYLKERSVQPERQTDSTPSERNKAIAIKEDHVWNHVRFQVVHLADATSIDQLETMESFFDKPTTIDKAPTRNL